VSAKRQNSGITMVELMVTIVVVAGTATLGIATLRGYLQRQQLLRSAQVVEDAMQRGQAEATARSKWVCVRFLGQTTGPRIFVDLIDAHSMANQPWGCGPNPDPNGPPWVREIGTVLGSRFRGKVTIAACSSVIQYESPYGPQSWVWFNTAGQPQWCAAGYCSPIDVQIVVSHPTLPSGAKSLEVEITSGGMIHRPKVGEKGLVPSIWAKSPTIPDGAGACE
jgi:type II secretory pathway pseudopilin PulG